ncbi:glycosyltransferase family 4 protein [Cellvibrio sp. QJXJ]|uniref:glycosyltransferase family 4 protein n=1 Tax=Cellvibrio sp. QJXJ TaxID=2964606 RepID=UPI0021C2E956|nr:glycosyltransferase family 4 protein [Cellvibrio sp. QJXJ]UUA71520.1 glycosyltransferase family 4 protein [Cellvibrio sp. QJXJ]
MSYFPVTNHQPKTTGAAPSAARADVSPTKPRALRIALLGYRSHPHVGGQGIYLQYLSKALVELGHSVDVISGPPYPELDPRVRLIQLPSLDLYAHPNPTRALRPQHFLSLADFYEWWSKLSGAFGEPYSFGRRLCAHFKKHKPQYDIVHDNQSLCYGLLDLQKRGVNVIATVHHPITQDRDLALAAATEKGQRWLINRWYSFLAMQKKVVQQLSHVITVSQQSQRDIAAAFDRPVENIHVIPNGVDTSIFKPLDNISRAPFRLITTASSDQPLKGLSVLLRALASLRNEFPELQLIVIGKLKENGETQKELQALNLQDVVQFKSGISNQELVEEYAQASIAIVPSLYEGFGLPAAEAMACAVPLICSDGGALPEVVGKAARLVRAGNVEDLQSALHELLNNEKTREQLGAQGRAHILQQLSWDCVGKKMERYYYQVLQQQLQVDPVVEREVASERVQNAYD